MTVLHLFELKLEHLDLMTLFLCSTVLQKGGKCAENKIKLFPSLGIFKNGDFLKYEGNSSAI